MIRLINIDSSNKEVLELKVATSQKNYIEEIADCMEEVKTRSYDMDWNPVAIYKDDYLIGFLMYGYYKKSQLWLDRFMIDERYQGHGYGKIAFSMILEDLKRIYNPDIIYLSLDLENKIALKMYESFGFLLSGNKHLNEVEMQLHLR